MEKPGRCCVATENNGSLSNSFLSGEPIVKCSE
jgi:hypothetical protein